MKGLPTSVCESIVCHRERADLRKREWEEREGGEPEGGRKREEPVVPTNEDVWQRRGLGIYM